MRNYKLIAIIFLAAFLRINYDTFIPGYNYDEIAIMSTAVQSIPFGIIKTAAENDYHAPLYQLIIHFLTYLPHEWVFIRLFNVLLSLLNIYIFYKLGCLIKDKNLGYILAIILSINHLAISTASFVKFYVLALLLVSTNLYYFIKIIRQSKGYQKLGVINALLILTSTYGFILSVLEYIYLIFKKRDKYLLRSILYAATGFLLYLPVLVMQMKLNFNNIFSPHSYYVQFAFTSFYNVLNDFFGPLLNYCCNLITVVAFSVLLNFIQSIKDGHCEYHYLIEFIIFSITPVAIALIFIFNAIKNNLYAKKISVIALGFLLSFILMTKLELTGTVPIYLYPLLIMLLVLFGIGICEFRKKKIAAALFITYIAINLLITNVYPPDKRSMFNAKLFYCYEEYFKTHDNIPLIATLGGRFVKKYYKDRNIIDFDGEKMRGNFQREYIELIYGKDISKNLTRKNAYELLKPLIVNKYRNPDFEKYFIENVYNKIDKNGKIVLSFESDTQAPFMDKYERYIKNFDKPYCPHLTEASIKKGLEIEENCMDTGTLSLLLESYSYEYLTDLLDKYFTQVKVEQYTRDKKDKYIKIFEDETRKYSTKFLAQNADESWIFITYQKQ